MTLETVGWWVVYVVAAVVIAVPWLIGVLFMYGTLYDRFDRG